jgi:hypothetical protein
VHDLQARQRGIALACRRASEIHAHAPPVRVPGRRREGARGRGRGRAFDGGALADLPPSANDVRAQRGGDANGGGGADADANPGGGREGWLWRGGGGRLRRSGGGGLC